MKCILTSIFIINLLLGSSSLYCDTLYGKNLYIPHLVNYSFPGFNPLPGAKGESSISIAYYGINEFLSYNSNEMAMDYESSVIETSLTYRLLSNLLMGVDIRFISYYGGFMDPAIELWHKIFNFPNGERHYFEQNSNYILLESDSYRDVELKESVLASGDMDLYSVWTIFNGNLTFALASAVKIPMGNIKTFTGSGSTDLGIQLLSNYKINKRFTLDLQQGVVFPLSLIDSNTNGYSANIQFQTLLSFTFNFLGKWNLINQFKIHTSPISYNRYKTTEALGTMILYTLPQFIYQIGVKKDIYPWSIQFYIEEDPFTYEGVDILINFRITKYLK